MSDQPTSDNVTYRSRHKATLEERQLKMAARLAREGSAPPPSRMPKNPARTVGIGVHCNGRQAFQSWLDDEVNYRKPGRISEVVKMFLYDTPSVRNPHQKTRLHMLLESLFKASTENRSPLKVTAAIALLNRAFGKESASDDELGALKKGGMTVVYVDRAKQDPDIPVVSEPSPDLLAPAPEFLETEEVSRAVQH